MFTTMHLRNFCQVSIEDVMTRSAVKSAVLDRISEGRQLKVIFICIHHTVVETNNVREWRITLESRYNLSYAPL